MSSTFSECNSLTSIIVTKYGFSMNNLEIMDSAFANCRKLKSIDLSNVDTLKVSSFENLFSGCESLESLNLLNFNTKNIQTMNNMFYKCKTLTSIDLSNFEINKVLNIDNMLTSCPSLKYINISSFSGEHFGNINISDFQADSGKLIVQKKFYNKFIIKPSSNWEIIYTSE